MTVHPLLLVVDIPRDSYILFFCVSVLSNSGENRNCSCIICLGLLHTSHVSTHDIKEFLCTSSASCLVQVYISSLFHSHLLHPIQFCTWRRLDYILPPTSPSFRRKLKESIIILSTAQLFSSSLVFNDFLSPPFSAQILSFQFIV